MSTVYFIHAQPLDLITGQRVSVRLAGGGDAQPFRLEGNSFKAGLVSAPQFSVGIEFGASGWTGGSTPNATPIVWQPSIAADLAAIAPFYWRKAPVTIDAGPDGGPFTRIFDGTIADATITSGALQMAVLDASAALDKPIVKDTFTGAGNLDGDENAKGRVKRRCFGVCRNVEGRLLLAAWSIYEFADPAKPLSAFTSVKDMGREGPITVLAWQGTAIATLDALKATTPPAGGAVVAPSIACVRWWTEPAGPLTADIQGELSAGAFVSSPVAVANLVLSAAGGPTIGNAGPLTGAVGAVGLYLDRADEAAATILDRYFARLGCFWTVRPTGGIDLFQWSITEPSETLQCRFIARKKTIEPAKELVLAYQINNRVHSDGEISTAVRTDDGSTLDEVLALARARGKLWTGAAFPTVGESNVGDTYVAPDGIFYDRVGGGIVLGGFALVAGGFRPALYWTPSAAQPLASTIATADEAYAAANLAIDGLAGLADDGVLSVNEKVTKLVPEHARLEAKWSVLATQAGTLGVSTAAAAAARTAWNTMLSAVTPAWNLTTHDSPIVRTDFNQARDAYDAALYALDQAIKAAVKGLADTGIANASAAQATANTAFNNAANAQTAADTANAALANIASDDVLTPDEKPRVILDRDAILAEKTGIEASATAYAIDAPKAAYTNAVAALTAYLATLTAPVPWSNLAGNTAIVGATFRQKFADVYATRQALLNAIAEAARLLANTGITNAAGAQASANAASAAAVAAQAAVDQAFELARARGKLTIGGALPTAEASNAGDTHVDDAGIFYDRNGGGIVLDGFALVAGGFRPALYWTPSAAQPLAAVRSAADTALNNAATAQADANSANAAVADIASDSLLTPDEKPRVTLDHDAILAEQAGIEASAANYSITLERTAYSNAVAALTAYLATLTAPVLWSNLGGNTTIVGATFRSKFSDVYIAKQALLNKIADAALYLANAAQTSATNGLAAAAAAATTATWSGVTGAGRPEDGADVTANAVRFVVPQYPLIEVRQGEAGHTGTRSVTHYVRRGTGTLSGGSWTILSSVLGAGSAAVNSSSGVLSLSSITQSGSYTIRYTHTDGVATDLQVNVLFVPVAAGVRSITPSPSLVSWWEGETTSVTVTHAAREDATPLSGGAWSIVSSTAGLISINSSTGTATITSVTGSGYYLVRYTHTAGAVVEKAVNIEFYASETDPEYDWIPPNNPGWNTP